MTQQPFFVPAMLILILCIPLALSLVPRNRFYGIRTSATLANNRAWYSANRIGGFLLIVSCTVYLLFSALFPMNNPRDPRFILWLSHLAMFVGPLIISIVTTIIHARRLKSS